MESTEEGCARTLFSETTDAAAYWGIIKPLLRPLSLIRKGGSPERDPSTRRATRRSEILANSAMAMPKKSIANAIGCP